MNKNTAVCRKHWPDNWQTISYHGNIRPSDPPSVFNDIDKSCIPTAPSKGRKTKISSFTVRNTFPDQLQQFQENDLLKFEDANISSTSSTCTNTGTTAIELSATQISSSNNNKLQSSLENYHGFSFVGATITNCIFVKNFIKEPPRKRYIIYDSSSDEE